AECPKEFTQRFRAGGEIGDGVALGRLGRDDGILKSPLPRNAKSKWHESTVFVEHIEAHGLSPYRGISVCCSAKANLSMRRHPTANWGVSSSSMWRQLC